MMKNYYACQSGVAQEFEMLMYNEYIPLPHPFAPCSAIARYVFQHTESCMQDW